MVAGRVLGFAVGGVRVAVVVVVGVDAVGLSVAVGVDVAVVGGAVAVVVEAVAVLVAGLRGAPVRVGGARGAAVGLALDHAGAARAGAVAGFALVHVREVPVQPVVDHARAVVVLAVAGLVVAGRLVDALEPLAIRAAGGQAHLAQVPVPAVAGLALVGPVLVGLAVAVVVQAVAGLGEARDGLVDALDAGQIGRQRPHAVGALVGVAAVAGRSELGRCVEDVGRDTRAPDRGGLAGRSRAARAAAAGRRMGDGEQRGLGRPGPEDADGHAPRAAAGRATVAALAARSTLAAAALGLAVQVAGATVAARATVAAQAAPSACATRPARAAGDRHALEHHGRLVEQQADGAATAVPGRTAGAGAPAAAAAAAAGTIGEALEGHVVELTAAPATAATARARHPREARSARARQPAPRDRAAEAVAAHSGAPQRPRGAVATLRAVDGRCAAGASRGQAVDRGGPSPTIRVGLAALATLAATVDARSAARATAARQRARATAHAQEPAVVDTAGPATTAGVAHRPVAARASRRPCAARARHHADVLEAQGRRGGRHGHRHRRAGGLAVGGGLEGEAGHARGRGDAGGGERRDDAEGRDEPQHVAGVQRRGVDPGSGVVPAVHADAVRQRDRLGVGALGHVDLEGRVLGLREGDGLADGLDGRRAGAGRRVEAGGRNEDAPGEHAVEAVAVLVLALGVGGVGQVERPFAGLLAAVAGQAVQVGPAVGARTERAGPRLARRPGVVEGARTALAAAAVGAALLARTLGRARALPGRRALVGGRALPTGATTPVGAAHAAGAVRGVGAAAALVAHTARRAARGLLGEGGPRGRIDRRITDGAERRGLEAPEAHAHAADEAGRGLQRGLALSALAGVDRARQVVVAGPARAAAAVVAARPAVASVEGAVAVVAGLAASRFAANEAAARVAAIVPGAPGPTGARQLVRAQRDHVTRSLQRGRRQGDALAPVGVVQGGVHLHAQRGREARLGGVEVGDLGDAERQPAALEPFHDVGALLRVGEPGALRVGLEGHAADLEPIGEVVAPAGLDRQGAARPAPELQHHAHEAAILPGVDVALVLHDGRHVVEREARDRGRELARGLQRRARAGHLDALALGAGQASDARAALTAAAVVAALPARAGHELAPARHAGAAAPIARAARSAAAVAAAGLARAVGHARAVGLRGQVGGHVGIRVRPRVTPRIVGAFRDRVRRDVGGRVRVVARVIGIQDLASNVAILQVRSLPCGVAAAGQREQCGQHGDARHEVGGRARTHGRGPPDRRSARCSTRAR